MKSVLIIDAHPLFRDFLKDKLSAEKVEVITASESRDAFTKMITTLPNLIIMDRTEVPNLNSDFFAKKLSDPNTAAIPIIITGPATDKSIMGALARYGVIKYFTKPIKFDVLFESIGSVLHLSMFMDTTPCVLDIHRNNNIIFIEIAQGLNREKIALLKFKMAEMIELEKTEQPKIIIMLTNLELTFVDGLNLEYLFDNILDNPRIHRKNVKVLSLSSFVSDLIDGHREYAGIEVSKNLPKLLNTLVDSTLTSSVSDLITEKILSDSSTGFEPVSSIETRFSSDSGSKEIDQGVGSVFNLAIIDSNPQTAKMTAAVFSTIGATAEIYTSGSDFMTNYVPDKFNLVILDVLIPDQSGFDILKSSRADPLSPPVLVYTQNAQRELIVKVLGMGASAYLVKPQKPDVLLSKSLQLLNHRK